MKNPFMQCSVFLAQVSLWLLLSFYANAALAVDANIPDNERRLTQLLGQLKAEQETEKRIHSEREREFLENKKLQQTLLKDIQQAEKLAKKKYEELKEKVDQDAKAIKDLSERLDERAHSLKDLFSVARQAAVDTQQHVDTSIIASQYPDLRSSVQSLLQASKLPNSEDLKALWWTLLQDIKSSGEVAAYTGEVVQKNGESETSHVLRLGPFTALNNSHFLSYSSGDAQLLERASNGEFDKVFNGQDLAIELDAPFYAPLDPTRGRLVSQIEQKATLADRMDQSGIVGIIIVVLGALGLIFTLWRIVELSRVSSQIQKQLKQPKQISSDNPLGRILAIGAEHNSNSQSEEFESLEVKLNEAILREAPKIDRGTNLIKLFATVAPLLGLLGTVTGMIATFQAITLFGTGDPKLMAGGISQALVTTVLGLVVAIPLLFGHSIVSSRVKRVLVVLSQESLGLVATSLETKELPQNEPLKAV